jgi:aldehyde dehydrogenase (NAD+)
MNPTADLFRSAVAFAPQAGATTVAQRRAALARLKKTVLAHREDFHRALRTDLGRPEVETDLSELYAVTSLVDYVSGKLAGWMRTERVPSPLTLWPAKAEIRHESKGAVLVMAPWNFPVNLSLSPVVYAVAAGNAVVLKPSEVAPATAQLLAEVLHEAFPEGWVRTVQGDAETAKSLLEHPWNHIFFTGGPSIGKTVMAAASKHLTSVTLELGGKSPVFLDPSFPVKRAAKLLAWAKSMNAGQICIAPDYVLVPREQMGDLVHAFAHALKDLYGDRLVDNPDYTRIINERHWARLQAWHEDAVVPALRCGSRSPQTFPSGSFRRPFIWTRTFRAAFPARKSLVPCCRSFPTTNWKTQSPTSTPRNVPWSRTCCPKTKPFRNAP